MADQNPSDSPSLPPIPAIPFQAPTSDQPAPSTPSEVAAASLSSSIENDLPMSEVVTALKSATQTPAPTIPSVPIPAATPILTEVKTEIVPPAAQPSAITTTVTTTPAPTSTPTPQMKPDLVPPDAPSVTTTVSVTPPPAIQKGPLYEDPDLVKVPGTQ